MMMHGVYIQACVAPRLETTLVSTHKNRTTTRLAELCQTYYLTDAQAAMTRLTFNLESESEPMKSYLHIKAYGQGPHTFLGIPGFGATHYKSFGNMFDLVPEHVTFYGMDPPGLGQSPLPSSWAWAQVTAHMVEGVEAIVEKTGGPITLVGACSGSFHAMEIAKRHPEYIKELILLEPFGYTPWFLRTFLIPKLGYAVFHAMFGTPQGRGFLTKLLSAAGVMSEYNPIASFADVPSTTVHSYLALYHDVEKEGAIQFKDITSKKRVFHGTNTFGAVKGSIPMWKAMWPDLDIITIPDVGHQLTQDKPDIVNAHLFDHLR